VIYFERLKNAPTANSAEEAIDLIAKTLDQVEDEFSGIPKNPSPSLEPDGRMYPPQADYTVANPDIPGGYIQTTRGHKIYINPDGSIRMVVRTDRPNAGRVDLEKPGGG
jgi:hypothetical protein